jgi:uncharacterized repeat protein (TIGR01451 family)
MALTRNRRWTAMAATALIASLAWAVPARAEAPPIEIERGDPYQSPAVVVERTAGQTAGEPDVWRMNMDILFVNLGMEDLVLEEVTVRYAGGSNPSDLVVDAAQLKQDTGLSILPQLSDGDGNVTAAGNVSPAGEKRRLIVPEHRVLPFPVPYAVTVEILFEGYSDPFVHTWPLKEYESDSDLGSLNFPGAARDLPPGQYWAMGNAHTLYMHHRVNNAERFAEDSVVVRWDAINNTWTPYTDDPVKLLNMDENDDALIWGMPLYSAVTGRVEWCANGYPDNPDPPNWHPGVTAGEIPGNQLFIRSRNSEEMVFYAHMQEGSIPESLCPADYDAGWHSVSNGPVVRAGQYIGRVGNSGTSSGAHLHLQVSDGCCWTFWSGLPLLYRNARSVAEPAFVPTSGDIPAWNVVDGAATTSHLARPTTGALVQPLPRANLVATREQAPYPLIAGGQSTWTITIENYGPEAAADTEVTFNIPEELTYVSDTGGCTEGPEDVLTCHTDLAAVPPEQDPNSFEFEVVADVPPNLIYDRGGPMNVFDDLQAESPVEDGDPKDSGWTHRLTHVVAQADLAVTDLEVIESPEQVLIGGDNEVTVRATVTSDGPSSPMNAVLSTTASGSGAGAQPDDPELAIPALEAGESRQVETTLALTCQQPGLQTVELETSIDTASFKDGDPNPWNDSASTSIEVECVTPVAVNIAPGGAPEEVHPGLMRAAVLTTAAGEYELPLPFEAAAIDESSVLVGDRDLVWEGIGGATPYQGEGHMHNVHEVDEKRKDGDLDMLFHFRSEESGLGPDDGKACIAGMYLDGSGHLRPFFGCEALE